MRPTSSSLTRFAWLSILAAVITIGLKVGAYLLTGSVGLLSEPLESLVNFVAVGDAHSDDALPRRISRALHDDFGIEHATLHVEHGDLCDGCPLAQTA